MRIWIIFESPWPLFKTQMKSLDDAGLREEITFSLGAAFFIMIKSFKSIIHTTVFVNIYHGP